MADARGADIWLCATPIGNLSEISPRLISTLESVDFVLAEDTRVARKLLNHLDISKEIIRFDEHSASRMLDPVMRRVMQGESLALMSDAGTPTISDPGHELVRRAQDEGLRVSAVSGPVALAVAFSLSGISASSFYFGAFLPRKRAEIIKLFESLASLDAALIFYESPKRLASSLEIAAEVFPEREGFVARELTKLHEECLRLPLPELAQNFSERESIKGEIVLIIGPPQGAATTSDEQIEALLRHELEAGLSSSDAVATVAKQAGIAKNRVYKVMLSIK